MPSKKVLIVEDDHHIAMALEIRLKSAGYRPVIAVDGIDGWEKVRSENPGLVILDITLPSLDGYTLCNMIKGNDELRGIPVIMLTGKDMIADVEKGYNLGAVSYFRKPYNWAKLLECIKKHTP